MEVLIDTSVLIDKIKNKDYEFFENNTVYISFITAFEYLVGEMKIGRSLEKSFLFLKRLCNVVYINEEILLESIKIYRELESKGKKIPIPNVIIAATSKFLEIPLMTLDTKHFSRIKGMKFAKISN